MPELPTPKAQSSTKIQQPFKETMMRVTGTRFGEIELDDAKTIVFSRGLIGFPDARRYVLLEPRGPANVAWLQSLDMPELAFPVVNGAAIAGSYPEPSPEKLAHDAGIAASDVAVLVIVAATKGKGLVANLLAPVIVDLESRSAAQVVLDPAQYAAAAPLTLGSGPVQATDVR
jgi:flagellar assembly factor FliW